MDVMTVNGWVVAPLFTETSGRPYSYNIFGGSDLSGGRETINGSGGAVYLPTVDGIRCGCRMR